MEKLHQCFNESRESISNNGCFLLSISAYRRRWYKSGKNVDISRCIGIFRVKFMSRYRTKPYISRDSAILKAKIEVNWKGKIGDEI